MTLTGSAAAGTARSAGLGRRSSGLLAGFGLAGVTLAVALRVHLAGVDGARSVPAGLAFGMALIVIAAALGVRRPAFGAGQWAWGLGGAFVLCAVPLWHRIVSVGSPAPSGQLIGWASVVTFVAVAEEAVLRGAIFEAMTRWRGENVAIAGTAVAFALVHVPVYGWAVLPLDLAVGVGLGVLRVLAGSVTAPAVAHVVADLAGWFLR